MQLQLIFVDILQLRQIKVFSFFFFCVISEPNFVYMDFVGESFDSPDGDDDKVYLFFSENAMEYDFYSKVAVSRVARVCKVHLSTE